MAKFELRFLCNSNDGSFLTCKVDEGLIEIVLSDHMGEFSTVFLDKSTAIKFSKTVRTEINKITESEGKDV